MTEEEAVVKVGGCTPVDKLPAILEKWLTFIQFGTYLIYMVIP